MTIKKLKDQYQKDLLIDPTNFYVMMEWEKPYMKALIKKLNPKGDVLEIGFGLGYSANEIQKYKIKSHTIIEADPTILKILKKWAKKQPHPVSIIEGTWQSKLKTLGTFDSIFFDDSPHPDYPDIDQTRVYTFYYDLLKKHVNKNAHFTWYCDKSIYWIAHPTIQWSLDQFKIKIPDNCKYVPQNWRKNTVYIPLIIFKEGVTDDIKKFILNNDNQMRID